MAPLDEKWFGNPRVLVVAEALELEAASLGYPVQGMLGKNGWDGTLWSVLDWNFRVIMRMCTEGRLSCVVCSRVSQPRFKPASCGRKPGKTSRSPSRSRSQLSLTLPPGQWLVSIWVVNVSRSCAARMTWQGWAPGSFTF